MLKNAKEDSVTELSKQLRVATGCKNWKGCFFWNSNVKAVKVLSYLCPDAVKAVKSI